MHDRTAFYGGVIVRADDVPGAVVTHVVVFFIHHRLLKHDTPALFSIERPRYLLVAARRVSLLQLLAGLWRHVFGHARVHHDLLLAVTAVNGLHIFVGRIVVGARGAREHGLVRVRHRDVLLLVNLYKDCGILLVTWHEKHFVVEVAPDVDII